MILTAYVICRSLGARYARSRVPTGWGTGNEVVPFGCSWESDQLRIDDEKAVWVHRIYQMRADGLSLRRIVRVLDENGVRTNKGNMFSPQAVLNILNNPFYLGVTRYGNLVLVGHHDPVVA